MACLYFRDRQGCAGSFTLPKSSQTRLSIITPVLNGESYIACCVQNVIDQGLADIEHVIVDGGSTDATLGIIRDFQDRYPHLRLIGGPDKGQSDAMNKGIRAAAAPIIGILNCDDFYQERALAEALDAIEKLPVPSLVVGNTRVIDGDGKTVSWNRPWDLRLESLVLGWRYTAAPQNPSAYFYHKRVHDEVGYYDVAEHYSMDTAFIFACAQRGINMVYVDRHWGNFRLVPGAKTYESQQAGSSQPRLLARYRKIKSEFSWKQHLKMQAIRVAKQPRRCAWVMLHGMGLR